LLYYLGVYTVPLRFITSLFGIVIPLPSAVKLAGTFSGFFPITVASLIVFVFLGVVTVTSLRVLVFINNNIETDINVIVINI
jgi:hypothetical protein